MVSSPPTIDDSVSAVFHTDIITIDPSNGGSLNNNYGYIRAWVAFMDAIDGPDADLDPDIIDVSDDIISLTTDQGTSKQEGDATAKFDVVLNNNNQKYARRFTPQVTMVFSYIDIERCIVDGASLKVVLDVYPLYFGRVQEVNMDHEVCTVSCGDEGTLAEASVAFDITWFPDVPPEERAQDIINALEYPSLIDKVEPYLQQRAKPINIEGNSNSAESGASGISGVTKSMSVDWQIPSDQLARLLIVDGTYQARSEDVDMLEFTLVPADNESIVGHCNSVAVIGDSTKVETDPDKNLTTSDSSLTTIVDVEASLDQESIDHYGIIEAPRRSCPWLSQKEANQFAINLMEVYKSYENRLITPTVVSKIPLLNSRMNYYLAGYSYPDDFKSSIIYNQSGIGDVTSRMIDLKVMRKKVEYSNAGVVVQLECKRYYDEATPGTEIPEYFEKYVIPVGDKYELLAYNPRSGVMKYLEGMTKEQMEDFLRGYWPDGEWVMFTGPANEIEDFIKAHPEYSGWRFVNGALIGWKP